MAEEIVYDESMIYEEEQPTCPDRDWNCIWETFYEGYVILVEVVVQTGTDEEGNPVTEVYGVDVTGWSNEDIEDAINDLKELYPDAVEYRVHYCGNHIGKPCKIFRVG